MSDSSERDSKKTESQSGSDSDTDEVPQREAPPRPRIITEIPVYIVYHIDESSSESEERKPVVLMRRRHRRRQKRVVEEACPPPLPHESLKVED
jgi:hypothetical protein